jgi:hypothetical protein
MYGQAQLMKLLEENQAHLSIKVENIQCPARYQTRFEPQQQNRVTLSNYVKLASCPVSTVSPTQKANP